MKETLSEMRDIGFGDPTALGRLICEWREEYISISGFGRDISIDIDTDSFDFVYVKVPKTDLAELLTHICDHLLLCGANDISLKLRERLPEIRFLVTAKTACSSIINSAKNEAEFSASAEALDHAEKRILRAYKTVTENKGELVYTRDEDGRVYIELSFDRVDIGKLGFKSHSDRASVIIGIKLARIER